MSNISQSQSAGFRGKVAQGFDLKISFKFHNIKSKCLLLQTSGHRLTHRFMAGRQIKPFKGVNDLYDTGHGHVYAEKIQPLPDNLRKKILLILEAFPSKSKSEIAEVLQACDYDVTKALNCFVPDGEMEGQNEWMVMGKRKKKKKKSGKKDAKDTSDTQSQNDTKGSATTASVDLPASTTEKQTDEGQKKVEQNIPTETSAEEQPTDKPTTTNNKNPTSLNNLKPVSNDDPKSSETTPTQASPLLSSPVLSPLLPSPTDSLSSSQDLQTSNKTRTGSSSNEKHPRQRTTSGSGSGSGSDVLKKTLKDLQRSAVSISRYQSMLDEQAHTSTKMLTKSFQAIRQTLDEREKYLEEQLQSVTEEAKKRLEDRQEDAAVLKFKCNRVGMTEEETTELRNEIKHFVGERKIDEDLGKIILFLCDEEKMLETVRDFGEVPPIKHHYTSYQRKHPEPSKPVFRKPPPVETTTAPSSIATTAPANVTTSTSNEVKNSSSRNERRPVLSPAGLKDQAEMHARLQQAVKQQQVSPVSKEGTKQADHNATEKPKPKDFGSKSNRSNNSKEQQSRREQTSQRQRQTGSSQNSTKSFRNRNENKSTNSENSKTPVQSNGAKTLGGSPADSESQAQDRSPAKNGTQGKDGSSGDDRTQAQANKPVGSSHVTENHVDRKTKRRYYRKTPVGDGSPVFRPGTVKTSNNSSSIKENGDQSKVKNPDLPNGQIESPITNGRNGFVTLPQRNRRPGKYYLKKEPGSKIEFPPARENGSVPA